MLENVVNIFVLIFLSVTLHNVLDFYNLFCLCCIVMSRRFATHYVVWLVDFYIYIYMYIRLKIKPSSVRIIFLSCQIVFLPSTAFKVTPLIRCSTNLLALCPAPWTTRQHPLHKNGASIVEVLPCLARKI